MQKPFDKRLFTATEIFYNFVAYYVDSIVIFNFFLLPFFVATIISIHIFDDATPTKNRMAMLFFESIFIFYAGEACVKNRKAIARGKKSLSAIMAVVIAICVAFILLSVKSVFADVSVLEKEASETAAVELADDIPSFLKEIIERDGNAYIYIFQHMMTGDEEFRDYDTRDVTSLDVACAMWDAITLGSLGVYGFRAGSRLMLGRLGRYESTAVLEAVSTTADRTFYSAGDFVRAVGNQGVMPKDVAKSIRMFVSTEEGQNTLYSGLKYASNGERQAFIQELKGIKANLDGDLMIAHTQKYNEAIIRDLSETRDSVDFVYQVASGMQKAADKVGDFANLEKAVRELRGFDAMGEGIDVAVRNEGRVIVIDGALNVLDNVCD